MLRQLLGKLPGHLLVVLGRDIAQGVSDCQSAVGLGELRLPAGGAADAGDKGRILWKRIIQMDGDGVIGAVFHGGTSLY